MKRSITMVAAMASNRTIGKANRLPWKLPEDMAFFKRVTTGKAVLMGRKTLESFKGPLRDRRNVVLTRSPDYAPEGCEVVHHVEEALALLAGEPEIMVIGGEQIYRLFLPHADRLLLTVIEEAFEGDAHFPEFSPQEWQLTASIKGPRNEKNPYDYTFRTYTRT